MSAKTMIPGPRMPRPAQAAAFYSRPGPFFERCRAQYGDVFRVHVADEKPWVVLSHPDYIKQVFTGDPNVFHAGKANSILLPLLGDHSVLLLDGKAHLRQRKLLLPPFHGERMSRYGELMQEVVSREIATWPSDTPLQVAPRMQDVTLEVIMRAVFGMRDGAELNHVRELLVSMIDRVMQPFTFLMLAVLGNDRFRDMRVVKNTLRPVDEALFAEFARRREAPDLAERDDILSLLLQARHEDGSPMSDLELRDELVTLLIAGHETTATSLAWAVERLVRHPDKLQRLRDELDAGEEAYLDAVVKETLRLRPVLPVVVREVQEDVEIGGYLLTKGTRLACSISLIHRRPDIYPEPTAFRPERFLEQPAGTYTWIPFGGGVRRCLGASFALFELKTVLSQLVRELDMTAVDPASERVARRTITLTPGGRAEVRVRPRAAAARGNSGTRDTVAA